MSWRGKYTADFFSPTSPIRRQNHFKMSLQAIKYSRGTLDILDQLKLPHESTYVSIKNSKDGFDAIKRMVVRGAPAIAIVAALALAVELTSLPTTGFSTEDRRVFIFEKLDYLLQSRPTAVNLADAAEKLKKIVMAEAATAGEVTEGYLQGAERMLVDDVQDNMNIGRFGAEWILQNAIGEKNKVVVLTHCNTGFEIHLYLKHWENSLISIIAGHSLLLATELRWG